MSTRTSRKSANPRAKAPEPIITRTKSAQQRRQLRNKDDKKTEKPDLTKPEIKSPKPIKTVKRPQQSLLKPIIKESDDVIVIEQVEYYPNTLKRDVHTKKIMLKPKHNFKVIAATNKRKLATPQKGIKATTAKLSSAQNLSNTPKRSGISTRPCSSSDLSMQEMVRIMEETRSLTDEDFMEILTCPSPVWWEDPPDGGFEEDLIHIRSPERPPQKITKDIKKRKISNITTSSKPNTNHITTEPDTETPAVTSVTENKKDERFVKKKLKLENILGNIKNKTIRSNNEMKSDDNNIYRKVSESEGDISDMSFNEEEILKNLEDMEIPVEQSLTASNNLLDIKTEIDKMPVKEETIKTNESEVAQKNDNVDRENLLIELKPEITKELTIKSPVFYKDSILNTSLSEFKGDVSLEEINSNLDMKSDDIVILNSCSNSSLGNNDDLGSLIDVDNSPNSYVSKKSPNEVSFNVDDSIHSNNIGIDPITKANDLSEIISEDKIIPEQLNNENNPENEIKSAENTKLKKLDFVRGKLHNLLKQCESNRLENTNYIHAYSIPALPVTDVKEVPTDNIKKIGNDKINLEDDKNRLKSCDYCIEKIKNGMTDFSCEKCEMAPILPCGLCNFHADTKEILKKHVSSCKDIARISWSHNYVLNQT